MSIFEFILCLKKAAKETCPAISQRLKWNIRGLYVAMEMFWIYSVFVDIKWTKRALPSLDSYGEILVGFKQ
jgi:hypothetical protein